MTSQIKTVLLLGLLTGIILVIGQAMGGTQGLAIAFVMALVMNVGSYWFSDSIVLAMYSAQELSQADAPALHAMVEELCAKAGLPKPRIVLIPQESPNAFATGRDPQHAVVAVTQGILKLLSPEELRGVLGHELGHVAHRDILIQSVAAVLASVIVMLANMIQWAAFFGMGRSSDNEEGGNPLAALVLAMLAPFAATLIQMAISRSREYLADEAGARFSGNPLGLAGALEKLESYGRRIPMQANPATENLFIVNPLSGEGVMGWFATHPPIPERVARLREMARHMPQARS